MFVLYILLSAYIPLVKKRNIYVDFEGYESVPRRTIGTPTDLRCLKMFSAPEAL